MRLRAALIAVPLLVLTSAWAVVAFGYSTKQREQAKNDRPRASVRESASPARSVDKKTDPAASPVEAARSELVFLRDGVVYLRAGSDVQVLFQPGSGNVSAAPLGEHLAVLEGPSTADGDFAAIPALGLTTLDGEVVMQAGPGIAPVWSHDGTRVAFIRPLEERDCFAESCAGATEVAIASLEGAMVTVTEPGEWSILGWLGDRVLVTGAGSQNATLAIAGDGTSTELEVAPSAVWDGSPDGRWLVTSDDSGTTLLETGSSGFTGERISVDTDGRPLGEGAWTTTGRVVAVALDVSLTRVRSELVTFSPGDSSAIPIPGSKGVMGRPRIAPGGSGVAFPALSDAGSQLEIRHCSLAGSPDCRKLIPRAGDLNLLALR